MEKITEKYYLGSNKNSFILYERKVSEAGKETFKNLGYFTSLEGLYKALIEKEIKDDLTMIENIQKIIDLMKEVREVTVNYVDVNKENAG